MDNMIGKFANGRRDLIEGQIDRLNDRVLKFLNKNRHLQKDSFGPENFEGGQGEKLERLGLEQEVEGCLAERKIFKDFSRVCMKLEDVRSGVLRGDLNNLNLTEMPSSFISNSESVLQGEEIHIKELYRLEKQVKNIINLVESGETYSGSLKFSNVTFYFHVLGFELTNKDKLLQVMFPEEFFWSIEKEKLGQELIDLRKKLTFSDPVLQNFSKTLEKSLQEAYTSDQGQRSPIKSFDLQPKSLKPSESLQNFSKSSKTLKKCELNCRSLEWQNIETQLLNSTLKSKLKHVLKQEGELQFRAQELTRQAQDYQNSIKSLQAREKQLVTEQVQLDEGKKKLEKMKSIIYDKIDEINKSVTTSLEYKPTNYTSRATVLTPTSKPCKESFYEDGSSSSESFQNFEISETLDDPQSRNSSRLKKDSLHASRSLRASPRNAEKSFEGKKTLTIRTGKDTETTKPPVYRKSMRMQNDLYCSSLAYTKSLMVREERVAEKEAEIARREKEIHTHWMKHPFSEEFIPMIQKEMIKLKELQDEYEARIRGIDERMKMGELDLSLENSLQDEDEKRIRGSDEEQSHHSKMAHDVYSMMEEFFY